ncbi:MAG: RHS repeat protein, partial [Planctomycetes bacterium]|nr:RHS repeat protein [Planctomycetota bacterium]
MLMKDGKLERVVDVRDPVAEAFAAQFTDHYDDLAAAFPVYEELRRIAQMVGLVKWMVEQGVEVDLMWVDRHRLPEPTPLEVDSVMGERVVGDGSGTLSGQSVHRFFGGVVLSMRLTEASRSTNEDTAYVRRLQAALDATSPRREDGILVDDQKVRGDLSMPGVPRRALGAYRTEAIDLRVSAGGQELLLARHYDSHFGDETVFGRGWSPLLPRLLQRRPLPNEAAVALPSGGDALPVFLLTNDFGTMETLFQADPASSRLGRVQYVANEDRAAGTLRSVAEGGYCLDYPDGRSWRFDADGYLTLRQHGPAVIQYAWQPVSGGRKRLVQIRQGGQGDALHVTLSYDRRGRIREAVTGDGQTASYAYNDAGELVSATTLRGCVEYVYSAEHQLVEITRAGVLTEHIAYDARGRVRRVDRPRGGTARRVSYEELADGGVVVSDGRDQRVTYDARMRVVAVASDQGETRHFYGDDGLPRESIHRTPAGLENRWKFTRHERGKGQTIAWTTPAGAALDLVVDDQGRLSQL